MPTDAKTEGKPTLAERLRMGSKLCGPIKARHPASGVEIEVYHQRDAFIDITHLDREISRMPGLYAWYAQLRDQAKDDLEEARHQEHNVEEDLYNAMIEEEGGEKKVTDVVKKVKAHSDMRAAYRARMDAAATLRQLESAVKAMEEKRWCLQSLVKKQTTEAGIKDSL